VRGSSSGAKVIAAKRKAPAKKSSRKKSAPARPRAHVLAEAPHASSPPPPPALRVWLETKARMAEHLAHRVELGHIERAAHVLLEGDSGREADPIVLDAVATILERVADHACALEFGASGGQRVAAAEALESVQALLVKLAEPRRAEFVELIADYARRVHAAVQPDRVQASVQPDDAQPDAASEREAIAKAFIMSATRFDRAFRRLDEAEVLRELLSLHAGRKRDVAMPQAAQLAGALSAKVGAFNERISKRAAASFDKAWSAWHAERKRAEPAKRPR
jgi:hypothetical protein